jgi:predicted N-acetyltransferase YhbS
VEVIELGPLTPDHRAELEGDELDPFDSGRVALRYRPKDRHVALRDDAGRLVASTGFVVVDIEVDGLAFAVVGLGGVIVNAAHRGRGLGRQVVQAALAKTSTLGPRFALLFCHEDRTGFYRKLGFAEVSAEVVVKQPCGVARMPQVTMWRGFTREAAWPDGSVVVHSLPF